MSRPNVLSSYWRSAAPPAAAASGKRQAASGKRQAIVAVGNSLLTRIWHLLSNPQAHYTDLGADHYQAACSTGRFPIGRDAACP